MTELTINAAAMPLAEKIKGLTRPTRSRESRPDVVQRSDRDPEIPMIFREVPSSIPSME
jgi:hypothetical protein